MFLAFLKGCGLIIFLGTEAAATTTHEADPGPAPAGSCLLAPQRLEDDDVLIEERLLAVARKSVF